MDGRQWGAMPWRWLLLAAQLLLAAPPVLAAAELSMRFTQPSGTVRADETVEVWVQLESIGDETFSFDASSTVAPFGLPASITLPAVGSSREGPYAVLPFASYERVSPFFWTVCGSANFADGCQPFGYSNQTLPSGWFAFNWTPFLLAPGQSMSLLLTTYVPTGDPVPGGRLVIPQIGVGLGVHGRSESGVWLGAELLRIGPCGDTAGTCSFTRTVTAVPEPAAWLLWLGGVVSLAGLVRRRRAR